MERTEIVSLYKNTPADGTVVTVCGWAKNIRDSKNIGFIALSDGGCFKTLQVVLEAGKLANYEEVIHTGLYSSLRIVGRIVLTPQAKQPFELNADSVEILGDCPADEYPLQKKKMSMEYLRTMPTLRPRTNTFNAAFRVRSVAAYAIHKFFQENGFVYAHSPLLTASDCEGAGEMFRVTTLDLDNVPKNEGHCIRNRMPSHDPVHFSIIEDYISTTYANKMTAGPTPRNGMKAAIIGAGPAGLTIAVLLARWGYDITIFDARDKIGGVMRYGIPNYRLPDSVLDDFAYRHLELKDIKVRTNTAIGRTITIDDLFRDGYRSVFIGAGLWKANAMHIKGETLGNVAFGIDYLANSKAFRLGDDIAVIGVGNSAMDCARTAIRNGARHVTCYARRDEDCISASEHEVRYARLEGVGFRFCKAPVEIRENGIICRDTVKGEDGKFTQVEGSEMFYPHTGVIVSVSQGAENELVQSTTGIQTNQRGLLTVNEDGSTTREGVFAGGDAVMGARTVVEAVAIAKKVAESMDAYMKSLPADNTPDPYAGIPVFSTPTSDVLAKQGV